MGRRRDRSPAQILATILRARDPESSAKRAGLEWSPAFKGLITRARKGDLARAISYIERRTDYAARITPADILAARLRRFKPGSRGFRRLAKQLGRTEQELRALRNARSQKKRRAVYESWPQPEREIPAREWPEKPVRMPDDTYVSERMIEYLAPSPGEIRYIEHDPKLEWIELEAIWNEANYAPGVSPRSARENGGWRSTRRRAIHLPGLLEAAAIIAFRAGVTGPVLIRLREYSR